MSTQRWRVGQSGDGLFYPIQQEDGAHIATVTGKANSEFMVRACNSHDDLLAALEAIDVAVQHLERKTNAQYGQLDEAILCVRAAIAKVKGEQP